MALADLSAIGFWGFAAATFAAGTVECGWYTEDNRGLYGGFLMVGGVAQAIAGLWDCLRGSAAGGVILLGFGLYWMGEAIAMFPNDTGIAQSRYPHITEYNKLIGWYKLCWALYTIPMVYTMARASLCQGLTLFLVFIVFFMHALTGLLSDHDVTNLKKASGYIMIIAAALAYYMGCGIYLKACGCKGLPFGKPILPGGVATEEASEKPQMIEEYQAEP